MIHSLSSSSAQLLPGVTASRPARRAARPQFGLMALPEWTRPAWGTAVLALLLAAGSGIGYLAARLTDSPQYAAALAEKYPTCKPQIHSGEFQKLQAQLQPIPGTKTIACTPDQISVQLEIPSKGK